MHGLGIQAWIRTSEIVAESLEIGRGVCVRESDAGRLLQEEQICICSRTHTEN